MNNLVIDLEMCTVPRDFRNKKYRYMHETIQIGAVLLDENYKRIGTLSQYVQPEYGVIDPFIHRLTGIDNSQVRHAPLLRETLQHLLDWIGDREYRVYAWSRTDRNQLVHELSAKSIKDPRIDAFLEENRWTDYQNVFSKRYSFSRPLSLQETLERADIDVQGRFHDGLEDAVNTGRLIEKLELDLEFQLVKYEVPKKDQGECVYSLGSILSGLNLKLA
jgi:inhibitor of KinA sporulation pathway (predicted exonuclease)